MVPLVAEPAPQQAEVEAIAVMDQFFEAYKTYDMDKMLALHTDDAVWTWIDRVKTSRTLVRKAKWLELAKTRFRPCSR